MTKKIYNQNQLRRNLYYFFQTKQLSMNKLDIEGIITKGYLSQYMSKNDSLLSLKKIDGIAKFLNLNANDLITKDFVENMNTPFDDNNENQTEISNVINKNKTEIQFIEQKNGQVTEIPLYESTVSAGIPKEIFDYPPMKIAVAPIKQGAFAVKVSGDSMIDFKIDDGDTLVVFPTTELKFNQLVVAKCGDAYTVKKLEKRDDDYLLVPGNKKYEPVIIDDTDKFEIIGYVLYIMKKPFLS